MKKFLTALAVTATFVLPASAQDYYKGKTVTYIIATNPGGNYDAYGRLVGRHLEKKLGAAKIIFKNLPGAGHIIGANTLAASKPDGLTIGTFNTGLIYGQILNDKAIRFNLNDLSWVGKAAADARVLAFSNNSGLKGFEDLLNSEEEIKLAASGVGSASYIETKMLVDAFDLNVKMIPGFRGNEGEMSMLRGEVAGQIATNASIRPFIDAGNGFLAVAFGGDHEPQAIDYARDEKSKSIVNIITAMGNLGRLTAAPAGVPEPILQELRDAYMAVMEDPDFLADAEKLGLPIVAEDGAEVAKLVHAALQQSPDTVKIIAAALQAEIPTIKVTSDILSLEDSNKIIEFNSGNEVIKAKISGSRTKITIDGDGADRKALSVGMNCNIEYNPGHEEYEPKMIACNG